MNSLPNTIQNLTNRAIFRIFGNDAERYLNGQVSQDVRLASETAAIYSIVANFKGKMEGDFYIRRFEGSLLIDTSECQRESLFLRLDKYLIADDAEIVDVSDEFNLYHILGDTGHDYPSWECNRYGVIGTDYLLPASENLPLGDEDFDWDHLRISNRIPQWGNELDEDTLPPEARVESRAVSYTKGCYTGQEVISRMKSSGKTNRHLVQFTFDKEIKVPCELFISSDTDRKSGASVTSICAHDDKWIGLGYRTRKAEAIISFYDADENIATVV